MRKGEREDMDELKNQLRSGDEDFLSAINALQGEPDLPAWVAGFIVEELGEARIGQALQGGSAALRRAIIKARVASKRLNLSRMGLTRVPPEVFEEAGLKELDLSSNALETLPDDFDKLPGLTLLKINGNKLAALPESFAKLSALKRLVMGSNSKIKDFPYLIFAMPSLERAEGVPRYGRGAERDLLWNFLRKTRGTEAGKRQRLFAIVDADADRLAAASLSQLFEALDGSYPEMCQAALKAINARSAGAPLAAGASVTILGNTRLKKTEVKEKLKEAGIAYTPSVTEATTHIVVGTSPKELDGLDGRAFTTLSEDEMEAFVVAQLKDELFLMDTEDEAVASHAESISEMLLNDDPANTALGLSLIKTGGLPVEATTAIFLVARESDDAKLRAEARKLIKRYGSEALNKATAERSKLGYSGDKAERNTRMSLHQHSRFEIEGMDWIAVARFLRKRHGYGLSYVMEAGSKAVKLEVLREHIKDGALNYHDLSSPRYRPSYDNAYSYYSPEVFPAELFELTELTALDASWGCFGALPEDIAGLKNLKTLDLTGNMLSELPDAILKLDKLETLRIGRNQFKALPPQIKFMKGLKHLDIQGNRDGGHLFVNIEVPPEVRAEIPGCAIVDGLTQQQIDHQNIYSR